MIRGLLILVMISALNFVPLKAQFTGNNLTEYQFGDIPGSDPQYIHSIYEQFNLRYAYKKFRASTRLEAFYTPDSLRNPYFSPSQFSLTYRNKGLNLKAGHFYETLGNGLLFRGYEINNSIYEDQIYRTKQGFYRDAFGFSGQYSNKWMEIKALRGKSLFNLLPPGSPDRRPDLVTAAESRFRFYNQSLGAIWLNNQNAQDTSNYISLLAGGAWGPWFTYSAELAHRVDGDQQIFSRIDGQSYGIYLNAAISLTGFGISLEYKDYQDLFIGSGISDPPTLVKEHSYKLLNRSTHVPYYFDESGWQTEMFFVPFEGHLLTGNYSRSKNELGESDYMAEEYFVEWQINAWVQDRFKFYLDYSKDDLVFENARLGGGLYYTRIEQNGWSWSIETEAQKINRTLFGEKAWNIYGGLLLRKSTRFSAAFILEYTNDSKIADVAATEEIEDYQLYPGMSFSYKPNRKNTWQLFVGKRRGGPACTSGICYEVLDFKGIELRWLLRF